MNKKEAYKKLGKPPCPPLRIMKQGFFGGEKLINVKEQEMFIKQSLEWSAKRNFIELLFKDEIDDIQD